jgi:hypothetical protein
MRIYEQKKQNKAKKIDKRAFVENEFDKDFIFEKTFKH